MFVIGTHISLTHAQSAAVPIKSDVGIIYVWLSTWQNLSSGRHKTWWHLFTINSCINIRMSESGYSLSIPFSFICKKKIYLKARIVKAVRRSFVGVTGMFLQNLSIAWSAPFFVASAYHSEFWFDECLWKRIRIASATL